MDGVLGQSDKVPYSSGRGRREAVLLYLPSCTTTRHGGVLVTCSKQYIAIRPENPVAGRNLPQREVRFMCVYTYKGRRLRPPISNNAGLRDAFSTLSSHTSRVFTFANIHHKQRKKDDSTCIIHTDSRQGNSLRLLLWPRSQ